MRGTIGLRFALAAALVLAPVAAFADNDVTAGKSSGGELLVTVNAEAANVHFTFNPVGCGANTPCYEITAGNGMVGVPVQAGGDCKAQTGQGQSGIECPAAGVNSIRFVFKAGGTWSSYAGSGGEHAGGPCSPAPVTVETGSGGGAMSVNAWNGCTETVICNSPASEFTAAEVDAADTLRGTCSSVVKH